jgi:hypothetical protein
MISTGRFTTRLRKLAHDRHNLCSVCGSALPHGVAAYAGYTAQAQEVYVGDCCKSVISELASHMYWWWTDYRRPAQDQVLWRYMDLAKFIAMLRDRTLYFPRSDKLGDPFEGARGISVRRDEWKAHCLAYYRFGLENPPPGGTPLSPQRIQEQAEQLYQEVEGAMQGELRRTYVTCWHANAGESEAFWRLYAPPPVMGVAVRCTYAKLDAALHADTHIRFGHVRYINFREQFAGTYDRVFWKRASLAHEEEVRGVIIGTAPEEDQQYGISVPFDLAGGIDAVVTSPFAPPWFAGVVSEVMERFGFKAQLIPSDLLLEPFF